MMSAATVHHVHIGITKIMKPWRHVNNARGAGPPPVSWQGTWFTATVEFIRVKMVNIDRNSFWRWVENGAKDSSEVALINFDGRCKQIKRRWVLLILCVSIIMPHSEKLIQKWFYMRTFISDEKRPDSNRSSRVPWFSSGILQFTETGWKHTINYMVWWWVSPVFIHFNNWRWSFFSPSGGANNLIS